MIRIVIERRADDERIQAVSVDGHAEYAAKGEDIVCAGVSAVTVGTVNSISELLGVQLDHMIDDGLLKMALPKSLLLDKRLDEQKQHEVQLLLESMLVMLQTIQTSYGQYVDIQHKYKQA